jgi:hypothetical protein
VLVDGLRTGTATAGLFPADEEPRDRFDEAVYLRAGTVRDWLARRELEGVLR